MANKLFVLALLPRGALSLARLKPIPWITCASSHEVKSALKWCVEPGDCVCELGAKLCDVTTLIRDAVGPEGTSVHMDTSRKAPLHASAGKSEFRADTNKNGTPIGGGGGGGVHELNSLDQWRGVLQKDPGPYDIFVVDVGAMTGNDLPLTTVALVQDLIATQTPHHPPKAVILASRSLCRLAHRLIHAQRLRDGKVSTAARILLLDEGSETGGGGSLEEGLRGEPCIVAAVGVEEYRRTIPLLVRKGDAVLEVGCHLGTTTAEIHEISSSSSSSSSPLLVSTITTTLPAAAAAGGCLGVDVGKSIVAGARARHPQVPFAVGDAWHTAGLRRLRHRLPPPPPPPPQPVAPDAPVAPLAGARSVGADGGLAVPLEPAVFDVVYVDVGGLSGGDGLLEALSLLDALGNALEPRALVIKSLAMRRLASSLRPWVDVQRALARRREEKA